MLDTNSDSTISVDELVVGLQKGLLQVPGEPTSTAAANVTWAMGRKLLEQLSTRGDGAVDLLDLQAALKQGAVQATLPADVASMLRVTTTPTLRPRGAAASLGASAPGGDLFAEAPLPALAVAVQAALLLSCALYCGHRWRASSLKRVSPIPPGGQGEKETSILRATAAAPAWEGAGPDLS